MTPLPPQSPVTPPRYRFRVRGDHYTSPTFPAVDRPERRDPFDGGSWQDYRDPEPLGWDDLTPQNLIGGLIVFLAIAVFVFAVSIQP